MPSPAPAWGVRADRCVARSREPGTPGVGVVVPGMSVSVSLHLGLTWVGLLRQLHHSWASSSLTRFLSSHALCRTCGSPTLEAATACPARAAALCSAPTRSQSTRRPRPFSCSLQVRYPNYQDSASATPLAGLSLLFWSSYAPAPLPILPTTLHPSSCRAAFLVLFPTPISVFSLRCCLPLSTLLRVHLSPFLYHNLSIYVGLCRHLIGRS